MWIDRSDNIDELAGAWVKAGGELTDLVKDKAVSTGKYSYSQADLASVLGMARPVLARHGLVLTQAAETTAVEAIVSTTLVHASGQYVTWAPVRLPAGGTPQQTGSAITYARRYSALAALGLATEDDDGQSATVPPQKYLYQRSAPAKAPRTVEPLTQEEADIREVLPGLEPDELREAQDLFKAKFGCGLSQLPVERHLEALEWVESLDWLDV